MLTCLWPLLFSFSKQAKALLQTASSLAPHMYEPHFNFATISDKVFSFFTTEPTGKPKGKWAQECLGPGGAPEGHPDNRAPRSPAPRPVAVGGAQTRGCGGWHHLVSTGV